MVPIDKKISFENFKNDKNMTNGTTSTSISRRDYIFSITVIGILFFIFGFVTWLNSILIPFFKTACELNDFQAYFVTTAFYFSYFVMALPSTAVLKKTGFKNGMTIGLLIMAAAYICMLILWVMGMIYSLSGEIKYIPVIGKFGDMIKL